MEVAKQQKGKKRTNQKFLLAFVFAAATVFWGIIIYVLPVVSDALTSTWILEYGTLQVTDKATCYVVRQESVCKATDSGSIQYYLEEGTMVRKGTKILDITPGSGTYTALENGIVSYYTDGKEGLFQPGSMEKLKKEELSELKDETKDTKRKSAASGETVYKLVGGDEWFLTYWIGEGDIAKYVEGNSVSVDLPLGKIRGTIYKIVDEDNGYQIILRFNRYYEDLCKIRILEDVTITTSDYEGLLLRNGSIATKDGQIGVYVKDLNGDYKFTPVSVITTDGEYSLVESGSFNQKTKDGIVKVETVEAYDEILNSPKSK